MGHAKLCPPSGWDRWSTCPGAAAMSDGLPDTGSEHADKGTMRHLLANRCLVTECTADKFLGEEVFIGAIPALGWDGALFRSQIHQGFEQRRVFKVSEDDVSQVQDAVDMAWQQLEGCTTLRFEVALGLYNITGEEDAEGTADVIGIRSGEIVVLDFKFGRKNVPPGGQLKLYGLAAEDAYDLMYGPFVKFTLGIIQPAIHAEPQLLVLSSQDMGAFRREAEEAAARVRHAFEFRANWLGKEFSYLVPSEAACEYCRASASCPALAAHVQGAMGLQFADLDSEDLARGVHQVIPLFDAEALADKLKVVPLVEDWLAAVKAEAYSRAINGVQLPGFKLVQGRRGNRKWADTHVAEEVLKSMRLKQEEMYSFEVKSPTAIEKIFGPKGSAPSTKRWNKLTALVTQAEGNLSLVPDTDTRNAVPVKGVAPEDFDVIEALDPAGLDLL